MNTSVFGEGFITRTYVYLGHVVNKAVPVRLDDETLRLIDELVRLGVYSSRSEALRDLIKIGIKHVRGVKVNN